MIELTNLIAGEKINQASQPVDPIRKTQRTGDGGKSSTEKKPSVEQANYSLPQQRPEESREEIEDRVDQANKHFKMMDTSLQLRIDEDAGRLVILVTNRDTGEVIRQFPSDQMLALSARLKEVVNGLSEGSQLVGVLVDERT